MIQFNKLKNTKFWLTFVAVFVGTMVFQLAINGVFAATPTQQHFKAEVTGTGKAVIVIPGLMSDGRVWQSLTQHLANAYEVHSINIAGFGDTPKVDNPSLVQVKQQLLAYIRHNKLHKPVIIGHSLGGFMSFWLASSAPNEIGPIISVDGLPFVGPVFTGTNESTVASLAAQAQQIKAMYSQMSQQQLITQSAYGLSRQTSSEASKKKVMAMINTSDPRTVGEAIHTLLSHDLRQDIAKITSPVLLLGASGGFATKQQKQAAHTLYAQQLQALPSANLVMHTNARHFIMFDDPKWLTVQVESFLRGSL